MINIADNQAIKKRINNLTIRINNIQFYNKMTVSRLSVSNYLKKRTHSCPRKAKIIEQFIIKHTFVYTA